MGKIIEFFSGKKTYLVGLAIGVVVVAQYNGLIDGNTAEMLYGLLGAGGVITIRGAITKSGPV